MAHFREDEARSIIHDAYAQVRSDGTAVAEALYAREEIVSLPPGAVALALGVSHPVLYARIRPGEVVLDLGCGCDYT